MKFMKRRRQETRPNSVELPTVNFRRHAFPSNISEESSFVDFDVRNLKSD